MMKSSPRRIASFGSHILVVSVLFAPLANYAYADENQNFHIVQKGETFSEIIYQKMGSPLYGKSGYLLKSILLNSHIKNFKLIQPGQKIRFLDQKRVFANTQIDFIPTEKEMEDLNQPPPSKKDHFPFSGYTLAPSFYFSSINGKDVNDGTSAELISKVNFLIHGLWSQNISEKFSTNMQASIRREEYYASDEIDLKNTSLTQGGFGVGARYKFSDKISLTSLASYSQETFYRAQAAGSLVLESVSVPRLSAGVEFKLLRFHQYQLNFNSQGIATAPVNAGDYDLKLGKGFKTSLELNEDFSKSKKSFCCNVFYTYLRQDSKNLDQTKKELGMGCALSWRPGEVGL